MNREQPSSRDRSLGGWFRIRTFQPLLLCCSAAPCSLSDGGRERRPGGYCTVENFWPSRWLSYSSLIQLTSVGTFMMRASSIKPSKERPWLEALLPMATGRVGGDQDLSRHGARTIYRR